MTPDQLKAIDDLQTAGIDWALQATRVAIRAGNTDGAISYLALAINRHHTRRFDRMIDDFQTTLRAERPLQPDHLTDDNYPDSTARWDEDREPTREDDE
jgi:hypothetical protein